MKEPLQFLPKEFEKSTEGIRWKELLISLAVSLGTGVLSVLLTPNIQKDYAQLYRPPLAPPGWAFPVVWTILFVLMGVAAYRIWISGSHPGSLSDTEEKVSALKRYGLQLLFNLGWSVIFFRFKAYLPAFLWLLILWYLVYVLIRKFEAIDKTAGKLLWPYIAWLTFAAYLNLSIALHYL